MLLTGETLETLVSVRVSVDAHHLEDLLETLARLDFPVNPNLIHAIGAVSVEFPAYTGHVNEIKHILGLGGFDLGAISVVGWGDSPGPQAARAMPACTDRLTPAK